MAPSLKLAVDRYLQAHRGIDLRSFVLDRRDQTPPMSWGDISGEIAAATDGIFEIAAESLRTWSLEWTKEAA